jgi:hypothetical protein
MHDPSIVESTGPGCGRNTRPSVILLRELRAIRSRLALMLRLHVCHLDVMIAFSAALYGTFPCPQATLAAVIAHSGRGSIDHPGVIGVVDDRHVDIVDCAVVAKVTAFPPSAQVAGPDVTKPVINSPIEPDVRTPIARVP